MSYTRLHAAVYEEELHANRCQFTKYRRTPTVWYDVIQTDRDYARWVAANVEMEEELLEAIEWGIDHIPERIG